MCQNCQHIFFTFCRGPTEAVKFQGDLTPLKILELGRSRVFHGSSLNSDPGIPHLMKRTILCICEGSSWHLHYLEELPSHRNVNWRNIPFWWETSCLHFWHMMGCLIGKKRLGGFRESRYVRYQLKCAFLETWPVIIWSEITTPIRRVKSPSETHLFSGQKSHLFAATWAAPEEQRPKNSSLSKTKV